MQILGLLKTIKSRRKPKNKINMVDFFCEYCGFKSSSIQSLKNDSCVDHPRGPNKGKHKFHEDLTKIFYQKHSNEELIEIFKQKNVPEKFHKSFVGLYNIINNELDEKAISSVDEEKPIG
jgi:hypothetical protein